MRKSFSGFMVSYRRLWAAVALTFFLLSPAASWACTTIVVGKNASLSGNILMARTEDLSSTNAKRFVVYPAGHYKQGQFFNDNYGFVYTFTRDSYKFTGTPDMAVNGDGLYDEHGVNEHGLAVSGTNTTHGGLSDVAKAADPLVDNGIREALLPTILLAEARTVDEAITLAGKLVEDYGAAENFVLLLADQDAAWIFEIFGGHRWVASRVPDDSFVIVANDMVTEHYVSNDTANVRGTPDINDFAIEKGFAVGDLGTGQVNLAASYGRGGINAEGNSFRRWRGYSRFAPSLGIAPRKSTDIYPYPTFVKAERKISVRDVMDLQRDRYQNTPYDLSPSPQVFNESGRETDGGTPRPIGTVNQIETHIYEMVKGYPAEIGARWWMAMAQSEHSVYLPYYGAITDTHSAFKKESPNTEYDAGSAFWVFQDLGVKARSNRVLYGRPIQTYWRAYEQRLMDAQAAVEADLLSTYASDPVAARRMITDYTIATANAALNRATLIRDELEKHIFLTPDRAFQVPADTVPYMGVTPVTELAATETAAVANALGLAASEVTAAALGTFTQTERGWASAPEIEGYTSLDVSGVSFQGTLTSGNTAKIVYNAELKGDDYAKFGKTRGGVINDFALFKAPVAGTSGDVRQLVGPAGAVSLPDAIAAGIASVYATTNDATVTISYYLFDGEGNPAYKNGVLVVPDGNRDGYLNDPLWAKKRGSETSNVGGSGGGGGGCSAGAGGMALLVLAAAASLGIRRRGF